MYQFPVCFHYKHEMHFLFLFLLIQRLHHFIRLCLAREIWPKKIRTPRGCTTPLLSCHDGATVLTQFTPSSPHPHISTRVVETVWRYKSHIIFVTPISNIRMPDLVIFRWSVQVCWPPPSRHTISIKRNNVIRVTQLLCVLCTYVHKVVVCLQRISLSMRCWWLAVGLGMKPYLLDHFRCKNSLTDVTKTWA